MSNFDGEYIDYNQDGFISADEMMLHDVLWGAATSNDSFDDEDELLEKLEDNSLDYDDLENMDEDERRAAILDADLDPDDFDDFF